MAEPLKKQVSVDLIGTPLSRALETIGREIDLNLVISPQFTGALEGSLINLNIDNLPASKALNLIGIATESDWFVREGVVLVAPKDYVRSLRVETRVYDIRELLESVPNYVGPDLSINGTLSNTSSGGSSANQSESYGQGGLFGDDSGKQDIGEDTPTRQELVDQIVELVISTVGEPNHWIDENSTLTELNGNMIVKTTPEDHEAIGKLLTQLSASRGRMIISEGQFFVVPRQLMEELDGKLILNPGEYSKLIKKLARGETNNVRRISSGRTVCFNGQRVYVYAGGDKTLVSDIEPVPDTSSVDPTLSVARNGAVLDIKPTITLDNKHISVALRTEAIERAEQATTAIPVGMARNRSHGISGSGKVEGTAEGAGPDGKDADVDGKAHISGSIHGPQDREITGNADIGLIEQDILTLRSNVRVPDGGGVVLSGITNQFENVDADQLEVVFVLRMRVVK
ncbi:MAG: hypothetical protein KTR15_11265 [Phycisphaeraceae bacterium]|nr:hypothetical protein [Phycisphaeraceae bacterium]